MKVGLYRLVVNQAQGYLLNANYFRFVFTERKHSNPPPLAVSWCEVWICCYVRVKLPSRKDIALKPSIESLQQTSVNLTFQRGNVPQRFTGRFYLWKNLLTMRMQAYNWSCNVRACTPLSQPMSITKVCAVFWTRESKRGRRVRLLRGASHTHEVQRRPHPRNTAIRF